MSSEPEEEPVSVLQRFEKRLEGLVEGAFAKVFKGVVHPVEILNAILEEAAKVTGSLIAPLNRSGDEEGAQWVDGDVRTPAGFREAYATMVRRAAALSPICRICAGVGPMKVSSLFSQISENSAFSARKPYPGWMASAPLISAAAMMRGMLR